MGSGLINLSKYSIGATEMEEELRLISSGLKFTGFRYFDAKQVWTPKNIKKTWRRPTLNRKIHKRFIENVFNIGRFY